MTELADVPGVIGNSARFAAAPIAGGGTSTREWLAGNRFPTLDLSDCPALVLVAPHPDDETLGMGATAAHLAAAGVDVQVVSVSDGGGEDPELSAYERILLERTRTSELMNATRILGLRQPIRLRLPDGEISLHEERVADLLTEILDGRGPNVWCATTWRGDGHPDHEAVGRAAAVATATTGAELLEYPVWMWHWARPGDPAVPWDRALSVPASRSAVGLKQLAAQSFRSQFEPTTTGAPPVIPRFVLSRLFAVGELVFR